MSTLRLAALSLVVSVVFGPVAPAAQQAPAFSDRDLSAAILAVCGNVTAGTAEDRIGGTPEKFRGYFSADRATFFVTLLSTTYREGASLKHIVVLGAHGMDDGAIADNQAATTGVYVGVLNFKNNAWTMSTRAEALTDTGFNGRDPAVALKLVGTEHNALEISETLWNQGSGQSIVSLYDLRGKEPAELLVVTTDADDCGFKKPCITFEGKLTSDVKAGSAVYDLRLEFTGTYRNAAGRVLPIPANAPFTLTLGKDGYEPVLANAARRALWEALQAPWG